MTNNYFIEEFKIKDVYIHSAYIFVRKTKQYIEIRKKILSQVRKYFIQYKWNQNIFTCTNWRLLFIYKRVWFVLYLFTFHGKVDKAYRLLEIFFFATCYFCSDRERGWWTNILWSQMNIWKRRFCMLKIRSRQE